MKIFVLIEPDYRDTFWCQQTLDGIYSEAGKKRYELYFPDSRSLPNLDWDSLYGSEKKLLILIGTSVSWIPEVLELTSSKGIHVILVSYQPPHTATGVSSILMDHAGTTHELVKYLLSLDKQKICLFGINPNSSADMLKTECFLSLMKELGDNEPEKSVFKNYASLERCFYQFYEQIGKYDGVICANDVVAVSFIKRLSESGIRVPEDIFVASFGDTLMARLFKPSLTTASLNHEELGRQAVSMYAYLNKNPYVTSSSVKVACKIHVRQSTMGMIPSTGMELAASLPAAPQIIFYSDPEVNEILAIEAFITQCDEFDLQIIMGLMNSVRYSSLAEQLSASENTIKYRIKRMLSWLGKETKGDLVQLLGSYLSVDAIETAILMKKRKYIQEDVIYG